ncbi:hypothetical protein Pfo_028893 [Paulownia fortunei]|nr:hypothetical protein Pfo_028893 [Paulownia fortunei]
MEELIKLTGGTEDDELVKELLDDISPFFMQPHQAMGPNSSISTDSRLLSAVYSGPTMEDIESALSYTNHGIHNFHHEAQSEAHRISMLERGFLNKANHENYKYTLRIKSCGNVMADDGYKWRKYGQKSIKNSQIPAAAAADPPIKKQKGPILEAQYKAHDIGAQTGNGFEEVLMNLDSRPVTDPTKEFEQELMGQQGLLEDVVPLMIRKPLIDSTSSNSSSSASHESHPSSPASSNSFSWSPTYFIFRLNMK